MATTGEPVVGRLPFAVLVGVAVTGCVEVGVGLTVVVGEELGPTDAEGDVLADGVAATAIGGFGRLFLPPSLTEPGGGNKAGAHGGVAVGPAEEDGLGDTDADALGDADPLAEAKAQPAGALPIAGWAGPSGLFGAAA
jgi:hypothetical protein